MPRVYFVGCGPGDPDLITVKAKKLLQKADTVIYSGSLIPEPILGMCRRGTLHDASGLVREEIFELLRGNAMQDKLVVRLHDGDPSIYGAIKEQIDGLDDAGIECEIVPGVTAFLASAAALGIQLTLPGVTQTIILTRAESRTRVPQREKISELARHGATMIFYLSVQLLPKLVREAKAGGYAETTPAAVVYRASWKDQRVIRGTLSDIAGKTKKLNITRTAIVMIGDVIDPVSYEYSRLYDKKFSHTFRRAKVKG